ncbi:MAG: hypothetical protein GXY53_11745 [Desulfobulbus sp.]|nr:hypothetical protein [Desulfobulbus sp.]
MFFGLDRATDEKSFITFLRQFSEDKLLSCLVPRMSEEEIHQVVDLLTLVMRSHLSSDEYHRLFLGEDHEHH